MRVWSLAWLVLACSTKVEPPEGTEVVEIDGLWADHLELVPAVRTPRTTERVDATEIYLRPSGLIRLADPNDRRSLLVPPGTSSDRVERRLSGGRWVVADVRGTDFTPDGESFHAYRPLDDGRLFGTAFARGDPHAARRAVASMTSALRRGLGLTGRFDADRRAAIAARYSRLMHCAGCHEPRTPERSRGTDEYPRRATDASGLYSILATLEDVTILETYRPVDANADDPLISRECAGGLAPRALASEWPRCADGRVPRARLAVEAGLRRADPHVEAVCRSRLALAEWLAPDARHAWREEIDRCRSDRP